MPGISEFYRSTEPEIPSYAEFFSNPALLGQEQELDQEMLTNTPLHSFFDYYKYASIEGTTFCEEIMPAYFESIGLDPSILHFNEAKWLIVDRPNSIHSILKNYINNTSFSAITAQKSFDASLWTNLYPSRVSSSHIDTYERTPMGEVSFMLRTGLLAPHYDTEAKQNIRYDWQKVSTIAAYSPIQVFLDNSGLESREINLIKRSGICFAETLGDALENSDFNQLAYKLENIRQMGPQSLAKIRTAYQSFQSLKSK